MKNLKRLMTEFAILGMEPDPLDADNGLEFDPTTATELPMDEVEYELDADGNPVLDANGNPVPKAKPEAAPSSCTCNHQATGPMSDDPQASATMAPQSTMVPPEEDEFDFNI